ncbi:MAG TPA: carbamoyltransferase [Candidatus Omnitrophota bacterium]|nr:carbamoyltransferase [Candidatus Omnitrophota bacterium]HPN55827.1 carbamoyltransferase [Candidatus Omnitrophota bacterium]
MPSEKDVFILGLSAFYHDSAACLVKNGEIIAAAQEERFTRKKHDFSFPSHAVRFCLAEAGITAKDLSCVAFYEKPFIKFERILMTYLTYAPLGGQSFLKAMPLWLKQKLFMKEYLRQELEFDGEFFFPEHHESHAAAAFFPSPYRKAAVLTMDGVGEWATASYGVGDGARVRLDAEIRFPHSLGLLYSAFTYYAGFRVNSGEYKLMGLAPYGEPRYADTIRRELIDIKDDGSFRLNMAYFNYAAGLTMTNRRFHRLFGGPPRKPEAEITQRDMDCARSIQEVTEEIMLKMARHVHKETGCESLCLAGGVALNCVGNGRVLREAPFKNIWIQPAAGDAGGALGAALFTWYQIFGNPRATDETHDAQKGSFLGPVFNDGTIREFLETRRIPHEEINPEALAGRVAALIAGQRVVGLFSGRMEFGPRALGGRSIIADARSPRMQELLNLKIKFRESFRPFAPSVLEEKAREYFQLDVKSPYMLLVADIQERRVNTESRGCERGGIQKLKVSRSDIPAVTHVDYSARVQTVSPETNSVFYAIIKEFERLTGCAVVINTSFNIRGEPIVCSPEDAYRCFMRTNMDDLVLGRFLLKKEDQPDKDKYQKEDISRILD